MFTMCLVLCLEFIRKHEYLGAPGWLSQASVPTLHFGSGHDLRVMRLNPASGSKLSSEPT